MLASKVALCLVTATALLAQTNDINQRLRHALAQTGNAESAVTALANKNYDDVNRLLAAAPTSDNASKTELLSLEGVIAFLQGRMQTAASDFASAAKITSLTDADVFTEAMALVSIGDKATGRKLLEHLTQAHPDRPLYIYWLGKLDYDDHRYEDAANQLRKSLALDRNSARAWDSLGLTFDMQGHADQAREAFEKAVTLNRRQPHPSPWPPHNLGYWQLRANREQDAEASLRESLRYDPTLAQSHYHLGRTLEKERRDPEAIDEYQTAIRIDAASTDACYSLAVLYKKLHRDPEASAMFAEYKRRRQLQP